MRGMRARQEGPTASPLETTNGTPSSVRASSTAIPPAIPVPSMTISRGRVRRTWLSRAGTFPALLPRSNAIGIDGRGRRAARGSAPHRCCRAPLVAKTRTPPSATLAPPLPGQRVRRLVVPADHIPAEVRGPSPGPLSPTASRSSASREDVGQRVPELVRLDDEPGLARRRADPPPPGSAWRPPGTPHAIASR